MLLIGVFSQVIFILAVFVSSPFLFNKMYHAGGTVLAEIGWVFAALVHVCCNIILCAKSG